MFQKSGSLSNVSNIRGYMESNTASFKAGPNLSFSAVQQMHPIYLEAEQCCPREQKQQQKPKYYKAIISLI